jgi:hypothetical protein
MSTYPFSGETSADSLLIDQRCWGVILCDHIRRLENWHSRLPCF